MTSDRVARVNRAASVMLMALALGAGLKDAWLATAILMTGAALLLLWAAWLKRH